MKQCLALHDRRGPFLGGPRHLPHLSHSSCQLCFLLTSDTVDSQNDKETDCQFLHQAQYVCWCTGPIITQRILISPSEIGL